MTVEATLTVHVQPRARATEFVGWHGDAVKIRIKAPPVDGAANEALIAALADRLDVPRNAIRILGGASGRRKRISITGLTRSQVLERVGLDEA